MRPDQIEHIRLDLFAGVLEAVEGFELLAGQDVVLDRHGDRDEDVVLGFGLDVDRDLPDPEVDRPLGALDERPFDVQAGRGNPIELPEAFDDGDGLLVDGEE